MIMTVPAPADPGFASADDDDIRLARLRGLSGLFDGVAHEVNNLLHHLTLNLPVIREAWVDATALLDAGAGRDPDLRLANLPYAELRTELPDLLDEAVRRAGSVRRLLALLAGYVGRASQPAPEDVCLAEVVSAAEILMAGALRAARIRFTAAAVADLPAVRGDRRQLLQVVVLLLASACAAPVAASELALRAVAEPRRNGAVIEVEWRGVEPALAAGADPVIERIIAAHGGSLQFDASQTACTIVRVHLPAAR